MIDLAQRQTVYELCAKSGRPSKKGVQVSNGRWLRLGRDPGTIIPPANGFSGPGLLAYNIYEKSVWKRRDIFRGDTDDYL